MIVRIALLGVIVAIGLLVQACGTPTTTMSAKPSEQLNPALTPHQKAVRLAKSQAAAQPDASGS